MIKCTECKKPIIEYTKADDWLALVFFFEFLLDEKYIEETTYETMVDKLLTFKTYAQNKVEEGYACHTCVNWGNEECSVLCLHSYSCEMYIIHDPDMTPEFSELPRLCTSSHFCCKYYGPKE